MGYTVNTKSKDELIPLKAEKEILAIRRDIEKNVQHRGKNYEICFSAYTEIRVSFGYPKPNASCRTGCIQQMNRTLANWLKMYDKQGSTGSEPIKINSSNPSLNDLIKGESNGQLIPIQDRIDKLVDKGWLALRNEVVKNIGEEGYNALNKGKVVSKVQLAKSLLGL